MIDPWQTLTDATGSRPGSPMVTWYGSDGTRTELSVISFANAVAKTAGFLRDELMLEPKDRICLQLGLHWQTPVWLTAAAIVGSVVELDSTDQEPLAGEEARPVDVAVSFDAESIRDSIAEHKVVVSTHPFGLPGPQLPEPFVDHAREVMSQPDLLPDGDSDYGSFRIIGDQGPYDLDQIAERATQAAEVWGIGTGDTLLSTLVPGSTDGWLACWALPLITGCHVVMCAPGVDVRSIADLEKATRVLSQP